MTNPVTPNIGLNKIDRTSPSTTYFDLEKYIDQNADAVDRFAGETSESIGALEKRLDTEERREVVLQPGLQIVNAERSAPFKLSRIKGRTLVNLLGRDGSCDSLNGISPYQVTLALDNSQYSQGTALKVTVAQGFSSGAAFFPSVKFYANKKYVLIVEVRVANAEYARIHLPSAGAIGNNVTSTTFKPSVALFSPTTDVVSNVDLALKGTSASIGYFDAARIYEISEAEYAALANMTPEQVAAKYLHVDSIQPVRNPYTIRYGQNLLPPFYDYRTDGLGANQVISPYEVNSPADGDLYTKYVIVPAVENQTYTVSIDHNGWIGVNTLSPLQEVIPDIGQPKLNEWITGTSLTFVTPLGTKFIRFNVAARVNKPGRNLYYRNPMLTLGSEAKPFKPREDSMLALQTDLYADPLTGANADEVFEKDGQYFKLAKWKKVVLDETLGWSIAAGGSYPSYKKINASVAGITLVCMVTKYDGKVLSSYNGAIPDYGADRYYVNFSGQLFEVSVSNLDSGWGDNYTPTAEEIKAYFMGWKMYDTANGATTSVYNGTAGQSKGWVRRRLSDGSFIEGTGTLPIAQAPEYTPYQLVYQLATPTVKPIVSEGLLTFNEGDNQVEVGTGILVREKATPVNAGDDTFWINGRTYPRYLLSKRPSEIYSVYKNNLPDNAWMVLPVDPGYQNEYGLVQARLGVGLFDAAAAYSVTYQMQDKSPIIPFTGSYAANEKSILCELTDAVHQNATAVSVLMNKKQDKDALGWITPTLLNGWVSRNTGFDAPLSYRKIEGLGVQARGIIQLGTTGVVFSLPNGYRPEKTHFDIVMGYIQSQASYIYPYITITPAGEFRIDAVTTPPSWLIIDTIIPL
ncbi:hypothetical protein [Paenibacillus lautus]|uniref:hypothetical protein n=1 Tax=Paenibacillus lautus TaxID=1401 RepID=UPI002DB98D4D|nr:hypothetical protein [Paenibacillus lautus]MEC0257652.1 hypothetical protein [Paenibacillus lautus]